MIKTLIWITVMSLSCGGVHAGELRKKIILGIQRLEGDVTYKIGYKTLEAQGANENGFPISELEFPLDSWLLSFGGQAEYKGIRVGILFSRHLSDDPGVMKDSDWEYYGDPVTSSLYAYSENNTDLEVWIINGDIGYQFLKTREWTANLGIGLLLQYFEFKTINNFQITWLDSGPCIESPVSVGPFIDYDIDFLIPYFEGSLQYKVGKRLVLGAGVLFSPLVEARDTDWHYERDRVSKGRCDGNMYGATLQAVFFFYESLEFSVEFQYRRIETNGYMEHFKTDNTSCKLNEDIHSSQYLIFFSMEYTF